jgi:DNA primase
MIDLTSFSIIFKNNENYIIQVIEALGCTNIRKYKRGDGSELRFAFPGHNNATCGVVNIENLLFSSFHDEVDYKGTLIGFVQYMKKFNLEDAILWMCQIVKVDLSGLYLFPSLKPKICTFGQHIIDASKRGSLNLTEKTLDMFDLKDYHCYIWGPHFKLLQEGITAEAQDIFHIGYDLVTKRILFPHRYWAGDDNTFVGIIGRTTNPYYDTLGIPKYYPLERYPKSMNLYGLYENLKMKKPDNLTKEQELFYRTIKDDNYIIIYEAEKSVLKRASWHDYTGVALMGHELSNEQINIINSLDDVAEVIFALDNDISVTKIQEMCNKIHKKRTSYIIDKFNILGPKDSPADTNPRDFEILLKNRVKNYEYTLKYK